MVNAEIILLLFAARKPSDDSLHMPADENSQLPATTFPTNWTVTHTKADEEEASGGGTA